MKAIVIEEFGGPDVLKLQEQSAVRPGPPQVLLKIEAVGVNFIDTYQRSGLYKVALPYIPGLEASGIVAEVGAAVSEFKRGDRVMSAAVSGGYAEYALVDSAKLLKVPECLSFEEAAALPLQGMTAHYLARSVFVLKPGVRCLVHAGAGGVGLMLIQIAEMLGAEVFATVSTSEKAKLAREAGARHVINYREEDFAAAVRRIAPGGIEVVFDSVGKDTFMASLECLAPRGMLVSYGQSSGAVGNIDPLLLSQKGSLFLTRPTLGHYTATREELLWRATELVQWLTEGRLKLRVGARFRLAEAAQAHRALEGRTTTGKVLLVG